MSNTPISRSALPYAHWPAEDQAGWAALLQQGGLFEVDGAGADWRPATKRNLQACYGHWLGFLMRTVPDLLDLSPAKRVTVQTVEASSSNSKENTLLLLDFLLFLRGGVFSF